MKITIITLFAVLVWTGLLGQQTQSSVPLPDDRPSIGLVLSGGGAKGFAHVGVLRVIDSLNIPIDYIAGTSMGAIVGAMYAIGYPVDTIEKIVRENDWISILSDQITREQLTLPEKDLDSKYVLSVPLERGSVVVPSGVVSGQNVIVKLNQYTSSVHDIDDFNDFRIPFTCYATDLETGEAVEIRSGYLPSALRATSSFPSFFKPVIRDERLLADGGIVKNFPVRETRKKGVDIIIGVDVQANLYCREDLNSVFKVLDQTSSFLNKKEMNDEIAETDIYIAPDLEGYSVADFDLGDSLIHLGYKAAIERIYQLSELQQYAEKESMPRRAEFNQDLKVASIEVEGLNEIPSDVLNTWLDLKAPARIGTRELQDGLNRAFGSRFFETITYRTERLKDSDSVRLIISAVEKQSIGEFKFGLHYDDDLKTALLFNATFHNLFKPASYLSADAVLGDSPRFWVSYYQNRGRKLNLGVLLRSHNFSTYQYLNRDRIAGFRYRDFSGKVYGERMIKNRYAGGLGLQLDYTEYKRSIRSAENEKNFYGGFAHLFLYARGETLDDKFFPNRGSAFHADFRAILQNTNETEGPVLMGKFEYKKVFGLSADSKVIFSGLAGLTLLNPAPIPYRFFLGSAGHDYVNNITPFVGFAFTELEGDQVILLRADIRTELFKNNYVYFRSNVASLSNSIEETLTFQNIYTGFGLGYGWDSFAGPMEFTITLSTNHNDILTYVNLGYWF